jgi:hypothetical protein
MVYIQKIGKGFSNSGSTTLSRPCKIEVGKRIKKLTLERIAKDLAKCHSVVDGELTIEFIEYSYRKKGVDQWLK